PLDGRRAPGLVDGSSRAVVPLVRPPVRPPLVKAGLGWISVAWVVRPSALVFSLPVSVPFVFWPCVFGSLGRLRPLLAHLVRPWVTVRRSFLPFPRRPSSPAFQVRGRLNLSRRAQCPAGAVEACARAGQASAGPREAGAIPGRPRLSPRRTGSAARRHVPPSGARRTSVGGTASAGSGGPTPKAVPVASTRS